MIKRSLKVSLKFANTGKLNQIDALWSVYKKAVNDFLERLLSGLDLSEEFLKTYGSPLSYRYKQCAKRQAMKIYKCWCRNKNKGDKPVLKNSSMTLDYRFVEVQKGKNSFDYWIKIATLEKGKPVLIPVKSYEYLNGYLADWELVHGGRLVKQKGIWYLILTFQRESPPLRTEGKIIGVDLGYRKLVTTSQRDTLGEGLRDLIHKAERKKQGSKAYYRAKSQIKNYVDFSLKVLFLANLQAVVVENLKNLKKNKKGVWSKAMTRKFSFWIYGYALWRLRQLCEVAGVQYHRVAPCYTSQRCPPCGYIERLNRRGELFQCLRCGFSDDADYVGALNILSRFTHESIVREVSNPIL